MTKLIQTREPVPVKVVQNVRAAFEVISDEKRGGVAAGLATLEKQIELYGKMGVSKAGLDLHAVFRSQAGSLLLTDEAYNRLTDDPAGNPNKEIIQKLATPGMSIELCAQTMEHHQWTEADILRRS